MYFLKNSDEVKGMNIKVSWKPMGANGSQWEIREQLYKISIVVIFKPAVIFIIVG